MAYRYYMNSSGLQNANRALQALLEQYGGKLLSWSPFYGMIYGTPVEIPMEKRTALDLAPYNP